MAIELHFWAAHGPHAEVAVNMVRVNSQQDADKLIAMWKQPGNIVRITQERMEEIESAKTLWVSPTYISPYI